MKPRQRAAKTRWDSMRLRRTCIAALVVLCTFMVMHAIFGENGLLAWRYQRKEFRELQKQVQELQRENHELEHQNSRLESDPKAIERLAREQLRLARPGEIIYTLPDQSPPNKSPSN
jgi:cell division protein FtsB